MPPPLRKWGLMHMPLYSMCGWGMEKKHFVTMLIWGKSSNLGKPFPAGLTHPQVLVQMCNIQRALRLQTGVRGQWTDTADQMLRAWLLREKRARVAEPPMRLLALAPVPTGEGNGSPPKPDAAPDSPRGPDVTSSASSDSDDTTSSCSGDASGDPAGKATDEAPGGAADDVDDDNSDEMYDAITPPQLLQMLHDALGDIRAVNPHHFHMTSALVALRRHLM